MLAACSFSYLISGVLCLKDEREIIKEDFKGLEEWRD